MEKLRELQKERERIEKRLEEINRYLQSPAVINYREVDDEGYPIADRDTIIAMRKVKYEYNCLQNDYTAIMEQITNELYSVHSKKLEQENVTIPTETKEMKETNTKELTPEEKEIFERIKAKRIQEIKEMKKTIDTSKTKEMKEMKNFVPLAIVKRVDLNSPAENAGLDVDDIIINWCGYTTSDENENTLQKIGEITKAFKEGDGDMMIEFTRQGSVIRTYLRPEYNEEKPYLGLFIIPY